MGIIVHNRFHSSLMPQDHKEAAHKDIHIQNAIRSAFNQLSSTACFKHLLQAIHPTSTTIRYRLYKDEICLSGDNGNTWQSVYDIVEKTKNADVAKAAQSLNEMFSIAYQICRSSDQAIYHPLNPQTPPDLQGRASPAEPHLIDTRTLELERKLAEAERQKAEINDAIGKVEEEARKLKKQADRLAEQLSKKESTNTRLKGAMRLVNAGNRAQKARIEQLEASIAKIDQETDGIGTLAKAASRKVRDLTGENTRIQKQLTQYKKEIAALNERHTREVETLRERLQSTNHASESFKEQYDQVRQEIEALKATHAKETEALQTQLATKTQQNQTLTSRVDALGRQVTTLTSERTNALAKIAELEPQLAKLKDQEARLKAQLAALLPGDHNNKPLAEIIALLKAQIELSDQHILDQKAKITALADALSKLLGETITPDHHTKESLLALIRKKATPKVGIDKKELKTIQQELAGSQEQNRALRAQLIALLGDKAPTGNPSVTKLLALVTEQNGEKSTELDQIRAKLTASQEQNQTLRAQLIALLGDKAPAGNPSVTQLLALVTEQNGEKSAELERIRADLTASQEQNRALRAQLIALLGDKAPTGNLSLTQLLALVKQQNGEKSAELERIQSELQAALEENSQLKSKLRTLLGPSAPADDVNVLDLFHMVEQQVSKFIKTTESYTKKIQALKAKHLAQLQKLENNLSAAIASAESEREEKSRIQTGQGEITKKLMEVHRQLAKKTIEAAKVTRLETENRKLKQQIVSLKAQLLEAEENQRGSHEEIGELKATLRVKTEELQRIQRELGAHYQSPRAHIHGLNSRINELESQLEELQARKAAENAAHQVEMVDILEKLKTLPGAKEAHPAATSEDLVTLVERHITSETHIHTESTQKVDRLSEELAAIKTKLRKSAAQNADLLAKLRAMPGASGASGNDASADVLLQLISAHITQTRDNNSKAGAELAALRKQLAKVRAGKEEAERKLAQLSEQIKNSVADSGSLGAVGDAETNIFARLESLIELQKQSSAESEEANRELEATQAENARLKATNDELTGQLKAKKQELAKLKAHLAELNALVENGASIKQTILELRLHVKQQTAKAGQDQSKIAGLEARLRKLETVEQEYEALVAKNSALKKQVADAVQAGIKGHPDYRNRDHSITVVVETLVAEIKLQQAQQVEILREKRGIETQLSAAKQQAQQMQQEIQGLKRQARAKALTRVASLVQQREKEQLQKGFEALRIHAKDQKIAELEGKIRDAQKITEELKILMGQTTMRNTDLAGRVERANVYESQMKQRVAFLHLEHQAQLNKLKALQKLRAAALEGRVEDARAKMERALAESAGMAQEVEQLKKAALQEPAPSPAPAPSPTPMNMGDLDTNRATNVPTEVAQLRQAVEAAVREDLDENHNQVVIHNLTQFNHLKAAQLILSDLSTFSLNKQRSRGSGFGGGPGRPATTYAVSTSSQNLSGSLSTHSKRRNRAITQDSSKRAAYNQVPLDVVKKTFEKATEFCARHIQERSSKQVSALIGKLLADCQELTSALRASGHPIERIRDFYTRQRPNMVKDLLAVKLLAEYRSGENIDGLRELGNTADTILHVLRNLFDRVEIVRPEVTR